MEEKKIEKNNNIISCPVLLRKEDDMIIAEIPDFPGYITQSDDEAGAIENARELVAALVIDYEESGKAAELPEFSTYRQIDIKEGEKLVYIQVWMPYYRKITKEVYVKKTLTIPKGLDDLARRLDINFSATLVKGIKEELKKAGIVYNET